MERERERRPDQHPDVALEGPQHPGGSGGGVRQIALKKAIQRKAAARKPNEPFPTGSEVWVARTGGYHHAGIYIGNNEVVHVFAEPMGAARALLQGKPIVNVVRTSLSTFLDGASLGSARIGPSRNAYGEAVVVRRAVQRVGESWSYNPLTNNCQHFTSKIMNGVATSPEAGAIQRAFLTLPGGVQQGAMNAAGQLQQGAMNAAGQLQQGATKAGNTVAHNAQNAISSAASAASSLVKKFSFW